MFSTSSSSFAFMALIQAFLDADRAGFRNGFAGWPLLPYSRMVAILALLSPSERGSEKPTFMSKPPFLSCRAGEVPRERKSSPVLLESYFVPLPMTDCRLERTLSSTTSAPASSTFGMISSVLSASRDTFIRKSSGIFHVALAIVLTTSISFTSVQARKLIHSGARPLPKKPYGFPGISNAPPSPVPPDTSLCL